jgi:hypothetical protein
MATGVESCTRPERITTLAMSDLPMIVGAANENPMFRGAPKTAAAGPATAIKSICRV